MAYRSTRYPNWRRGSNLEQVMNRMLEMESEPLPSGFPLDVLESDSEYTIKASIAGFDPERIEITYDDNTLSIRGEILEENTNGEEGKYHIRERSFGSFYRGISMPGVILSQLVTMTSASSACPFAIASTESAISSRLASG